MQYPGTTAFFNWIETHPRAIHLSMIPVLALMMAAVFALVYATGGIKYVFSHSMYIPILLSGLIYGGRGGIAGGIVAGLTLGPLMPIDTVTGEMQLTINWLYRMAFFTLIGFSSGLARDAAQHYLRHVKWIASHEPRTGLPNRLALTGSIKKRLDTSASGHSALVLASLENGLEIEAAFGFGVNDHLLREMARRCQQCLPTREPACYITAQELAFVVTAASPEAIDHVLSELNEQLQQPFALQDFSLHGDIHLARVPLDNSSLDPDDYLQKAESTLLAGRDMGQSILNYSKRIDSEIADNIQLLGALKRALDDNQLHMHFQPKVNCRDGRVISVEALMRWQHPEIGNIPPDRFIPRAERSTLIHRLTDFALDASLAQLARWRDSGLELSMAVNVSAQNLVDPGFVGRVIALLEKHHVPGYLLELEVTEGAFIHDIEHTIRELLRLAGANVLIAIDDFGTGYSSLKYMYELPASVIKIDQTFVRALPEDRGGAHIVNTAISLAHNMGLQVVAEGVETLEARDYLHHSGCDILQGYFIARPVSATDFTHWYQALGNGRWQPPAA